MSVMFRCEQYYVENKKNCIENMSATWAMTLLCFLPDGWTNRVEHWKTCNKQIDKTIVAQMHPYAHTHTLTSLLLKHYTEQTVCAMANDSVCLFWYCLCGKIEGRVQGYHKCIQESSTIIYIYISFSQFDCKQFEFNVIKFCFPYFSIVIHLLDWLPTSPERPHGNCPT